MAGHEVSASPRGDHGSAGHQIRQGGSDEIRPDRGDLRGGNPIHRHDHSFARLCTADEGRESRT